MEDTPESALADRRERRRKKRQDEVSLDSVSTVSKAVEETEGKRRKKKMKKINETSADSPSGEKKHRRKKKKGTSGSVSSSEEGTVSEKKVKKRREKKKLTGSQTHLLKEDFFSDRELATTLQGLEDDMYSVTGDGDTSVILSPYPCPSLLPALPPLPPSQPVAKIYTEKTGGFTKTRPDPGAGGGSAGQGREEDGVTQHQMSPLQLGLATQRVWRAGATFCHGLLAGLAAWQVSRLHKSSKDHPQHSFLSLFVVFSPLCFN